ncbi:unnamed protein product, partial [Brassica rapa subsp. narinosa]
LRLSLSVLILIAYSNSLRSLFRWVSHENKPGMITFLDRRLKKNKIGYSGSS